jgi:hypothetical protein
MTELLDAKTTPRHVSEFTHTYVTLKRDVPALTTGRKGN